MNELDFTGQTALVVGGTSGIGNAIARAFRDRGATVTVWGTRAAPEDYAGDEGSDLSGLHYAQVDVSDPSAIAAAALPDRLDVLVCSQGTVLYKRQEFTAAGWDKVMAVNVGSVMHVAQACYPLLKASGGRVVVVTSVASFRATMGTPAYAASKTAAMGLVRTLGQAWAGDGIRVNALAPSLVDTKLTKATFDHPERRDKALAKIPLGRFAEAEEMANVALFLASPLSSYVVGQTLLVDGGLTL